MQGCEHADVILFNVVIRFKQLKLLILSICVSHICIPNGVFCVLILPVTTSEPQYTCMTLLIFIIIVFSYQDGEVIQLLS